MGYEELWKTLSDLIKEFRKEGETIPSSIITELRSAKTLLHILKTDPKCVDNISSIESYLSNVESYLVIKSHKKLGEKFANEWMEKLKEARRRTYEGKRTESAPRFVPGLPRGKHWIRIKVTKETSRSESQTLAKELGLSFEEQEDGHMLIYGESERIKFFVKRIAEKFSKKRAE